MHAHIPYYVSLARSTPGISIANHSWICMIRCLCAVACRRAFLRRAVEEHPDKGGSAEAFAQVQAAYRALSMHATL